MIDCTLATCEYIPALDPDDRVLLEELRSRGIVASTAVWTDPNVDWSATRLCLVRSTWDYHRHYADFMTWVDHVADVTTIRNDRNLVRWSADKSYLRELELLGVPTVPTIWLAQAQTRDLLEILATTGWRDVVIKPARGAAAHDVLLVREAAKGAARGQAHIDRLARTQDVLVQPFLSDGLAYGERALVFIDGRYSHAVVKKPFDTVLAISGAISAKIEATSEEIGIATGALEAAPGPSLYARVDLLRDDNGAILVNEVELVEPALYFGVHDAARTTFADAVERELGAISR